MSRTDPQFNLRIPAALKAQVEEAAKHNKRSATAEIIARLEESFSPEIHRIIRAVEPAIKGPLPALEELQLNLEIVLEQLRNLTAARQK